MKNCKRIAKKEKIVCKELVKIVSLHPNYDIMAKPIKETPILTGSDAERFAFAVEHPQAVSREDVLRAKAVYERLSMKSGFAF